MKKLTTLYGLLMIFSIQVHATNNPAAFSTHLTGFFSSGLLNLNETVKNGVLVGINEFGDTLYVANLSKSQLSGSWRSWYPTRLPCDSGRLVKNIPDGEWKGWYSNGQLKFVYHFNARKLAALKDELRRQPKTKFYYIANKPPEIAAEYYNAERIFGHKSTTPRSIFLSRQINHKTHQVAKLKTLVEYNTAEKDDDCYLPPFTEALLHGNYTEYYENGKVRKAGIYINGLREGMWEEYTEAGTKAVGTYHHGYPKGEWRYYNEHGKLVKWKRFDSKGRLSEEFVFEKNREYKMGS